MTLVGCMADIIDPVARSCRDHGPGRVAVPVD